MESDHTDQWEILSQNSSVHSADTAEIVSPIHSQEHKTDDDTHSVHSIQSLESSTISTTSSIIHVNSSTAHASQAPSALIPDINEHKTINNENINELMPSYVNIESELQQQRELITELKSQLQSVTTERDQVCFHLFLQNFPRKLIYNGIFIYLYIYIFSRFGMKEMIYRKD